eukprot:gnl/Trimastix_PCT/3778.p1 GENE.gnl/Trimastix_PCT/3778~~gnl/Trimastix_PCT/3778.p1  ORF type:complete len:595 (-),score=111.67 gnl/Trimastix_PCT/3778:766-2427(-)
MELVPGGELFNFIIKRGKLSEDYARRFFQQIISGVEYCHKHTVVHRDLKPENLLLDAQLNVKIADFGLSNMMWDGDFLTTSCGSPNYAAPEVISGKMYAGPGVDVWSCGVILYALLCARLPFHDRNISILFQKIKSGQFTMPPSLPSDARDLIQRMLTVDPLRRITIPEIRHHPWFLKNLPEYLRAMPDDTLLPSELDEEVIKQVVVKLRIPREQCIADLRRESMTQASVMYNLIVDQKRRPRMEGLSLEAAHPARIEEFTDVVLQQFVDSPSSILMGANGSRPMPHGRPRTSMEAQRRHPLNEQRIVDVTPGSIPTFSHIPPPPSPTLSTHSTHSVSSVQPSPPPSPKCVRSPQGHSHPHTCPPHGHAHAHAHAWGTRRAKRAQQRIDLPRLLSLAFEIVAFARREHARPDGHRRWCKRAECECECECECGAERARLVPTCDGLAQEGAFSLALAASAPRRCRQRCRAHETTPDWGFPHARTRAPAHRHAHASALLLTQPVELSIPLANPLAKSPHAHACTPSTTSIARGGTPSTPFTHTPVPSPGAPGTPL